MDDARSGKLSALEKVFRTGADGLGYAASQVLNAMVDVSTHPPDPSARQAVLARAQEAAARFSDAGKQLDALQDGVAMDLRTTVVVNQIAKQIVEVNNKIAAVQGGGHTPNDLLDQRDQMVSQLSQYVQVSTMVAQDGSMGVFIGGGQRLVLGGSAQELTVFPRTSSIRSGSSLASPKPTAPAAGREHAQRRLDLGHPAVPEQRPAGGPQSGRPAGRRVCQRDQQAAGPGPGPDQCHRRARRAAVQHRRTAGAARGHQCSATPAAPSRRRWA
jgi:hypothetical protein